MTPSLFILDSGHQTGDFTMRLDHWLAENFLSEANPLCLPRPAWLLRIYSWTPAAISLGYNQPDTDFDKEKLAQQGIDLVRRPTGGRAVFHTDEITYSVTLKAEKSNAEHYAEINAALQLALAALGIESDFQKSQPDFQARYQSGTGAACFTASARYELEVHGKKILGSAQRRFGEILLQHGSLMLTPKHKTLVDFLTTRDQTILSRIAADLDAKTISVEEVSGKVPNYATCRNAIQHGFEQFFQTNAIPLAVNPTEFLCVE
jgi:lipoyl(octanoyl) transferase